MFTVEQYVLSNSIQLADALIGATAIDHGLPLLTGNDKHYKVIKVAKDKEISSMTIAEKQLADLCRLKYWCPGPESNRHGISTEGFYVPYQEHPTAPRDL